VASVNDIVELDDGSVGVVSEALPSYGGASHFRVMFRTGYTNATDSDVAQTLSARTYSVNDTVEVWPNQGTITAIDGDEFTVDVPMSEKFDFGAITWNGDQVVPRWRIILDNDERIQRVW
jgi:hypothetical protein